jgi:uridylate kinase
MGSGMYGISIDTVNKIAANLKKLLLKKTRVCLVIGGGNIFRGIQSEGAGFDRIQGDHMGMLATIINGMALQSALESIDVETRLLTAIDSKADCNAIPFIIVANIPI